MNEQSDKESRRMQMLELPFYVRWGVSNLYKMGDSNLDVYHLGASKLMLFILTDISTG